MSKADKMLEELGYEKDPNLKEEYRYIYYFNSETEQSIEFDWRNNRITILKLDNSGNEHYEITFEELMAIVEKVKELNEEK